MLIFYSVQLYNADCIWIQQPGVDLKQYIIFSKTSDSHKNKHIIYIKMHKKQNNSCKRSNVSKSLHKAHNVMLD